jgi:RNA polymerase sigma factor (sigma-70 family)
MKRFLDKHEISGLWRSFENGDSRAFTTLYECLYPELYTYGKRFNINAETLNDVIQDMFVKIYTNPGSITNGDTFRQFMFTSVRYECFKRIAYEQKHVDIDEVGDFDLLADVDANSIEDREEEEILRQKVKKLMEHLTPRQREIIYLRFFKNMEYGEITAVMRLTEESAYNLVHRAIEKIRKK